MKKLNSVYESSFSKFRISVQNSLGFQGGRRESSVVEETRTRIQGYYGTGKIMEKGFKVKNEESRIERSIDGISIDGRRCNASRSRPARSTSPLVYLCSCSLRGIRFKFDPLRHSFLSFLFFFLSFSVPRSLGTGSLLVHHCDRSSRKAEFKTNWLSQRVVRELSHDPLVSRLSLQRDKTCLAPREKNGTRVPRIVEFLTIFNSLDYI